LPNLPDERGFLEDAAIQEQRILVRLRGIDHTAAGDGYVVLISWYYAIDLQLSPQRVVTTSVIGEPGTQFSIGQLTGFD
jgi:hypothetical protein